uniref:Uncharacterized protein n=3 Tax=Lotharella globosa TaxID=91324 RepID=A0A7S4DGX9_9EUKA|mmetsp:Transcript_5014/g.9804  ORF Transcript_5014/g.9804 Transcript_5014/m.9804 type:complete len:260 (+) Transcript_5014:158-937(+)
MGSCASNNVLSPNPRPQPRCIVQRSWQAMRRRMARKRQQTAISGRDSDDPARPERAPNRRRSPWDEDWDLKIDDSDCYECDADNHLQVPAPSIESRAILMVEEPASSPSVAGARKSPLADIRISPPASSNRLAGPSQPQAANSENQQGQSNMALFSPAIVRNYDIRAANAGPSPAISSSLITENTEMPHSTRHQVALGRRVIDTWQLGPAKDGNKEEKADNKENNRHQESFQKREETSQASSSSRAPRIPLLRIPNEGF